MLARVPRPLVGKLQVLRSLPNEARDNGVHLVRSARLPARLPRRELLNASAEMLPAEPAVCAVVAAV